MRARYGIRLGFCSSDLVISMDDFKGGLVTSKKSCMCLLMLPIGRCRPLGGSESVTVYLVG